MSGGFLTYTFDAAVIYIVPQSMEDISSTVEPTRDKIYHWLVTNACAFIPRTSFASFIVDCCKWHIHQKQEMKGCIILRIAITNIRPQGEKLVYSVVPIDPNRLVKWHYAACYVTENLRWVMEDGHILSTLRPVETQKVDIDLALDTKFFNSMMKTPPATLFRGKQPPVIPNWEFIYVYPEVE